MDQAVRLVRTLRTVGFSDITSEDVNGLIDYHSDPHPDEDLFEMTKSGSEEEEDEQPDKEKEVEKRALLLLICRGFAISLRICRIWPWKSMIIW